MSVMIGQLSRVDLIVELKMKFGFYHSHILKQDLPKIRTGYSNGINAQFKYK